MLIMPPIPCVTCPIIISSGPIAATTSPTVMMVCRCPSSSWESQSANCPSFSTAFSTIGIRDSPKEMAIPSILLFNSSTLPLRLSCMVAAILSAAPAELLMLSLSFAKSSLLAFTMASSPLIASCPARFAAICTCSSWVSPANFCRSSKSVASSGLMLPSALVMDSPSSSIASAAAFGGFASLVRIARKLVPACVPLIPAFAIKPIAVAVSSMLYPSAPATGATYLKVSPIIDTLVLDLDAAIASTSANRPLSSAFMPKAVSASVTISDTAPKSSPDAAASFITPSSPPSISEVSQPAIAMYFKPSAASEAENFVSAPNRLASSVSALSSSALAPEIAATSLIPASKSAAVFTAAAPSPTIPVDTTLIFLPASVIFSPALWMPLPSFTVASSAVFCRDLSLPSVSAISLCRALYCSSLILPCLNCSCACRSASLRVFSFSLVASIALASACCFWVSISVFLGSSFKRRCTSFKSFCVVAIVLFVLFNASFKGFTSPPICIVMPFILSAAICFYTSPEKPIDVRLCCLVWVFFLVVGFFCDQIVYHAHIHTAQRLI